MIGILKFIIAVYHAAIELLDKDKNLLQHAPMQVKYMASILLASFWCVAFGIWAGELLWIGYNIIGHILVVSMAFVTWAVTMQYAKTYSPRAQYDLLRCPERSPKCYEMTDQERLAKIKGWAHD